MAVVPKHPDHYPHYDPKEDFTNEQRHRFTQVANQAEEQRRRRGINRV